MPVHQGILCPCQIVGIARRPFVIYRHRGVLGMAAIASPDFEGNRIHLASGVTLSVRLAHVPVLGPTHAPGRSLWEAVWGLLKAEAQEAIAAAPQRLNEDLVQDGLSCLFERGVSAGSLFIAGKEMPIRPGAPYTAFTAEERLLWTFDVVVDRATPRVPRTAAAYGALRVFTAAEWQRLAEDGVCRTLPASGLPASDCAAPTASADSEQAQGALASRSPLQAASPGGPTAAPDGPVAREVQDLSGAGMASLPLPPIPGADPDEGLELRLAVMFYAENDAWARRYFALKTLALIPPDYVPVNTDHPDRGLRDRGPLTLAERSELQSLETALLEDLQCRLQAGQLIARGCLAGQIEFVQLQPEWWRFATIDPEAGCAEANGVRVSGVLVYPAARPNIPTPPTPPSGSPLSGCAAAAEAPAPSIYRTGAPGRPTSAYLVRQEFMRRFAAGEVCRSLAAEARVLTDWLKAAHPDAPPMRDRTIENQIRDDHRRAIPRSEPTK